MASLNFFFLTVLACLLPISTQYCSSLEDHGINVLLSPPESQVELCKPHKVNLTIYYDTLSPSCASFFHQLENAMIWDTDLMAIINLRLVPFGDDHLLGPNKTIFCQNGLDECYLNGIEACAINIWPHVKQHLPWVSCVELLTVVGKWSKEDAWKSCCRVHNMSQKSVLKCYNSGYEKKLMLQYAEETHSLNPPIIFVPWVVLNGKPLYNDYENFDSYVCDAYQDYPKPGACRSTQTSSAETANLTRFYILYMVLLLLHHLLLYAALLVN